MAVLAQRVGADEALGAADRIGPVAVLLESRSEPLERIEEAQTRRRSRSSRTQSS